MNPTTPPTVTIAYAPEQSEARPWLILADQRPAYRLVDGDHALRALEVIPQLIAEGWEGPGAVRRAIEDTATMTTDGWEDA